MQNSTFAMFARLNQVKNAFAKDFNSSARSQKQRITTSRKSFNGQSHHTHKQSRSRYSTFKEKNATQGSFFKNNLSYSTKCATGTILGSILALLYIHTNKTIARTIPSENKRPLWHILANDFQHYTTTNVNWHAGDLYAHSVWTALTLEQWFEEKKFWIVDVDSKYKNLLIIAGYLHDIGKGGDGEKKYFTKPNHPQTGFQYLTQSKPYQLINSPIDNFDTSSYLNQLNFSETEQKIIAVLAGIHESFGLNVMAKVNNYTSIEKRNKIYKEFLQDIDALCKEASIPLDKQILIMSIAINAADVKAAQEVVYDSKLFVFPEVVEKKHTGGNPYQTFKFDTKGKIIYNELLKWYDKEVAKK